jgi:hypothetical protein
MSRRRSYPLHLKSYEQFDQDLLPLLAELEEATFDELSAHVADAKVRAALGGWLASAQWRGLVDRLDESQRRPRAYTPGPRAASQLSHAA